MRYLDLGKTGMKVSEVGLGCEYLEGKDSAQVEAVIQAALAGGVNLLDVFMSEPNVRSDIGKAIAHCRDKVYIQGHFRAVWKGGQYGRSKDLEETKAFFQDLLDRLGTDYIDIGMVHMVDTMADYEDIFNGPIYDFVRTCKEEGRIRAIGLSSHDPAVALRAVQEGRIDVLLFSLNAAYDLLQGQEEEGPPRLSSDLFEHLEVQGIHPERQALYQACETAGVGITVMKGLGAGTLLDAKKSPFGMAMTVPQCIHYALSRPAVASVLIGMQTPEEVAEALMYETTPEAERDYTAILASKPKFSLQGHCMYCNHCLPCPAHINIAQVNKYLDLAGLEEAVPPTIQAHYASLEHPASACVRCGACEERCPFGVPVVERMKEAAALFGK